MVHAAPPACAFIHSQFNSCLRFQNKRYSHFFFEARHTCQVGLTIGCALAPMDAQSGTACGHNDLAYLFRIQGSGMKKVLTGLALAFCAQWAQAEVTGVYVAGDEPANVYTVSRNGNSILLLQHLVDPVSSSAHFEDGQGTSPVNMYTMTYQIGQLTADGQSATVVGSGAAGACSAIYQLQFSDAGLRLILRSMQNPSSIVTVIDCPALATKLKADQQAAGGAKVLIKIF